MLENIDFESSNNYKNVNKAVHKMQSIDVLFQTIIKKKFSDRLQKNLNLPKKKKQPINF